MLTTAIIAAFLIAGYVLWIRPILKRTPALRTLFAEEETLFAAVRAKFAGIKQRLANAIVGVASVVVFMHDKLLPYVADVDVTPLTQQVPGWCWPLILIAFGATLGWFRKLADRRQTA